MKRINAIIKPNMLDEVIFARHQFKEFPGATMTEAQCMEHQRLPSVAYPVQVRIEIVCLDDQVGEIVTTIE